MYEHLYWLILYTVTTDVILSVTYVVRSTDTSYVIEIMEAYGDRNSMCVSTSTGH